jgi:hypothetical protein
MGETAVMHPKCYKSANLKKWALDTVETKQLLLAARKLSRNDVKSHGHSTH